jgi:hypothetical protein
MGCRCATTIFGVSALSGVDSEQFRDNDPFRDMAVSRWWISPALPEKWRQPPAAGEEFFMDNHVVAASAISTPMRFFFMPAFTRLSPLVP